MSHLPLNRLSALHPQTGVAPNPSQPLLARCCGEMAGVEHGEGGPGPHGYALQGHSPRLLCDQGHPCREVRGTGNTGASLPLLKGALDPYWGQHRSLDPPPAPQQHHQDGVRVGPLQAAPGGGTAQPQQRCLSQGLPSPKPLQKQRKPLVRTGVKGDPSPATRMWGGLGEGGMLCGLYTCLRDQLGCSQSKVQGMGMLGIPPQTRMTEGSAPNPRAQ